MENEYKYQGYQDVTVEPVFEQIHENEVKVTFQVAEGLEVTIKEIGFEGNEFFDTKTLRKQMKSKPRHKLISIFTSRGKFSEQQLQEDIQAKMRELRVFILEEDPDEEELSTCLLSINKLKKDLLDKEAEFDEFLTGQLTLLQQANYILFSQEFYRGLREELNRARSLQQNRRIRTEKR